jgi:LCP family protein required for cell wall assembly
LLAAIGFAAATARTAHWLEARPYRGAIPELQALPLPRQLPAIGQSGSEPSPPAARTPAAPVLPERPKRPPSIEGTENTLLLGLDRRPGARGSGLADTILVAVVARDGNEVGLISVPRDLYVDLPGFGPARINLVFGAAARLREKPLELFRRVVANTLLLPIDHAITVDLDLFEQAIDQVGGVSVNVPCPIYDDFIDPRTESGRRALRVEAGERQMDGATAAMYVRSRHGRSDHDRARRQQAVLLGLQQELRSIESVVELPALLALFEDSILTDMRRIDLLRLARRVSSLGPGAVHGLVLGPKHTTAFRTPEGQAVLLPNYDAIDAAVAKLFTAPPPTRNHDPVQCAPADIALQHRGPTKARPQGGLPAP